jgi:hypothetical protein
LKDADAETKYVFRLKDTLSAAKQHRLLDGKKIIFTASAQSDPKFFARIIPNHGGEVSLENI